MSEENKQEQPEQELNADELEEVTGGRSNNASIDMITKFVAQYNPKHCCPT